MKVLSDELPYPDDILDGLCDIARDSLRADKVYLMLYSVADVHIIAECRARDHLVSKRFPRELLNKDTKVDLRKFGNRCRPPRHLTVASCDFTNLISDNGTMGVLMLGFDQPQKRLTSVEKEIARRLAKTAVSHLERESVIMKSARKFLEVVDKTKL